MLKTMRQEYKIIELDYTKFNKQALQELHNYFAQLLDHANNRQQDIVDEINKTSDIDTSYRLVARQDMIIDEILWCKANLKKLTTALN